MYQVPLSESGRPGSYARIVTRGQNIHLVCREIFPFKPTDNTLQFMLPANPTKWSGTRTALEASLYSDSRPLSIHLTWNPAVSATTTGILAFGTSFSDSRLPTGTREETVRLLSTTNGAMTGTAWQPINSYIRLGSNLRANNFPHYNVDPDDIPFWILGTSTVPVSDSVIGYLVVEAVYSLHNPTNNFNKPIMIQGASTITRDEEKDVVTLSVPNADPSLLQEGQDFFINFGTALYNTAGSVVLQMLQSLIATFQSSSDGQSLFRIDSNFAATTNPILTNVFGTASNF